MVRPSTALSLTHTSTLHRAAWSTTGHVRDDVQAGPKAAATLTFDSTGIPTSESEGGASYRAVLSNMDVRTLYRLATPVQSSNNKVLSREVPMVSHRLAPCHSPTESYRVPRSHAVGNPNDPTGRRTQVCWEPSCRPIVVPSGSDGIRAKSSKALQTPLWYSGSSIRGTGLRFDRVDRYRPVDETLRQRGWIFEAGKRGRHDLDA